MDLSAGMLPPPGHFVLKNLFLFFDASAKAMSENRMVEARTNTDSHTDALFAAYTSKLTIAGANLGFGTIVQIRIASQTAALGPVGGPFSEQRTTIAGLGDLIVLPVMLGWNFGQFHLTAALSLYAPTGNYSAGRVIDIGVNRWAIEPDLAFTWMDEERGPPLLGKTVVIGTLPVTLSAKYEFEVATQNRSGGDALWLTAALMF